MKRKIEDITINYLESQAGNKELPPILFVHGWGGDIESLRGLYSTAVRYRYRAYIIDLPGFGNSDMPRESWGVDQYANIVSRFISDVIKEPVVYFGHSFGGGLGVYLASGSSHYISKLILCSAAVYRSPVESRSSRLVKKVLPGYDRYKERVKPIRRLYYRLFYPLSDTLKKPELESVYRKIITEDLTSKLGKITQPTLILWGDQDRYTSLKDGELIHDTISGSTMKVYEGIGHSLPINQPEKIFADMDNFMQGKK